jgi:hypothetical protein
MAKRKQLFHPDEVRAKIQASQLCNRLHQHAFGEIELSQTQIKCAEILLKKAMPDLSSVDGNLSADLSGSINFTWSRPQE